ncbi:hypothetical protein RB195_001479 [Necator americanus]
MRLLLATEKRTRKLLQCRRQSVWHDRRAIMPRGACSHTFTKWDVKDDGERGQEPRKLSTKSAELSSRRDEDEWERLICLQCATPITVSQFSNHRQE